MKIRTFIILLASMLLFACAPLQPRSPEINRSILTNQPTETPIPSATLPPTPSPLPTAHLSFFRDEFNEYLGLGWQWLNEYPAKWSLTAVPGSLQIDLSTGYLFAGNIQNVLLRAAPAGNFQIETAMLFRPVENFQFAGIIVYESPLNYLQVGRGYCQGDPKCIGRGFYMEYYENKKSMPPNIALPYDKNTLLYMRLTREGDKYTFDASADGQIWYFVAERTASFEPLQVGLMAGQNEGSPVVADFSFFQVSSYP
ncbi:MAG: DUF1349 domain-containing protein [Chloroflexi bacterium]|nr:DUF1349 domain-containing protein [Chloroflexota bacterium]